MRTAEEIRKLREKNIKNAKKGGGGEGWFSAKEGTHYIRICPPWKKGGEVWKDVYYHGGFKNKAYCGHNDVDEETGKTRKCQVCKKNRNLGSSRDAFHKKLWGLTKEKSEAIWNLWVAKKIKIKNGKVKAVGVKGPFKWRLSMKWHNDLLDIFGEEEYRETSPLGVCDMKTGRWIRVTRIGSGPNDTDYKFKVMGVSKLGSSPEERKEMAREITDLDKIVTGSTDEELQAFLMKAIKEAKHADNEDDDDDDEDEDVKKKKKKSKKSDDDDDEDEDSDDDDDDEDEDSEDDDKATRVYKEMKASLKKNRHDEHDEEDDD